MSHEELNDQLQVRRDKMQAMQESGRDPFGSRFERTHTAEQIKEQYSDIIKRRIRRKGNSSNGCRTCHDKAWQRESWICTYSRCYWENSNLR